MAVEVRDLAVGYGADVRVLHGVSVEVADGEILTVLGPNGSGKSTLLKAVMGYVPASGGEVLVDGQRVDGVAVHRRAVDHSVAYVPQLGNVFGPLSVAENLEVGGFRLARRERRSRVEELLEQYPRLGELRRSRADSLSGGERQMLAVARALMTRPRYLLVDEPSAGLSPLLTQRLFQSLAGIRASHGTTILMVEQNAAEALAVSDRGVVLAVGRIALAGPAAELLGDPRMSDIYLGGSPRSGADGRPDSGRPGVPG